MIDFLEEMNNNTNEDILFNMHIEKNYFQIIYFVINSLFKQMS